LEEEHKTKGGIIIPDTAKRNLRGRSDPVTAQLYLMAESSPET
jgi:co-chaperonin GroES (HSP10)